MPVLYPRKDVEIQTAILHSEDEWEAHKTRCDGANGEGRHSLHGYHDTPLFYPCRVASIPYEHEHEEQGYWLHFINAPDEE